MFLNLQDWTAGVQPEKEDFDLTTRACQPTTVAVFAIVATLALFAAMLSQGHTPTASAAGGGCPNANSAPNEASKQEFVKSITCLINKERTSRGLKALDNNSDLKGIMSDHVKKMIQQDCLKHRCDGESSIKSRLFESGYLNGADSFRFGENLGYEQTPNEMIDRWLASDYHKGNILNPKFKDLGVAVEYGSPKSGVDDAQFVTYSALMAYAKGP